MILFFFVGSFSPGWAKSKRLKRTRDIENLLENAIKYTPPGSPIDIAGRSSDNMLMISIADRGPGIQLGDEEQIFDKFYRANSAQGGVGLGLTICRAIVAAHGGRIWATNRSDGGAIFTFTLPLDGKPPLVLSSEL